jgi:ABC-type phosphate transport system auxiliary subunit
LIILLAAQVCAAQDIAVVEQRVEALRQQLRDVTDRQAQLQAREQELDEALRPENVEKSVAGIGTTDATALRDRRREQLEREKAVVVEQLQSLDASRTRLEAAIANAEAEAVRLRASALSPNNTQPTASNTNAPNASAPSASPAPAKRNARRSVKRRKPAKARRRASSSRRG